MLEALMALAALAGNTVVAAATTDAWEAARHKVAGLLGHGDSKRTEAADRWLAETHDQLTAAQDRDLEKAGAAQAQAWQGRFACLLDEVPSIEADLHALVQEIQHVLPAGVVSASDHAVAEDGDTKMRVARGGVAAARSAQPS
jgi:hypothetical protein